MCWLKINQLIIFPQALCFEFIVFHLLFFFQLMMSYAILKVLENKSLAHLSRPRFACMTFWKFLLVLGRTWGLGLGMARLACMHVVPGWPSSLHHLLCVLFPILPFSALLYCSYFFKIKFTNASEEVFFPFHPKCIWAWQMHLVHCPEQGFH